MPTSPTLPRARPRLLAIAALLVLLGGCGSSTATTSAGRPLAPPEGTLAIKAAPRPRPPSDIPGVVDPSLGAYLPGYGRVIVKWSTERYVVTRSGEPSTGPGDCRVLVTGPSRQVPVTVAGGASCAVGVRVVGLWTVDVGRRDESGDCYTDLCTHLFPHHLGFFCKTTLVGDSAWDVVCRRGRQRIYTGDED
jgi:hypothetical protein